VLPCQLEWRGKDFHVEIVVGMADHVGPMYATQQRVLATPST
jgi:hypothetical protein